MSLSPPVASREVLAAGCVADAKPGFRPGCLHGFLLGAATQTSQVRLR